MEEEEEEFITSGNCQNLSRKRQAQLAIAWDNSQLDYPRQLRGLLEGIARAPL